MHQKKHVVPTPMPSLTWRGRIYFWKVTGTKARLTEQSYKHEHSANQLYVALRKTGQPLKWISNSTDEEGRFDRAMVWNGVFIPFEVHRGTQSVDVVVEKAKFYTKENCRPIWTVQDYKPNPFEDVVKTAKQSGQEILDALRSAGIVAQPLITPHLVFTQNPLSPVLVSPLNKAFSLSDLTAD